MDDSNRGTEEALRASEARLRDVERLGQIGSCSWDAVTDIVTWSDELYRILGVARGQPAPLHEACEALFAPESWIRLTAASERALTAGEPFDLELELAPVNGEPRWAHARGTGVCDAEGRVVRLQFTLQDITARMRAEAKLRENEAVLERRLSEIENAFAGAPVGLAALDANLRYLRINQTLAAMAGISMEEYLGRTPSEVVPALAERVEPILRNVLLTGVPAIDMEIHGETPAQPSVQRDWVTSFYPLTNADNRTVGINLVVQEVTERKQLEQALRERQYELNEAQRLAGVGSWVWDLESDQITFSEELYHLTGSDPRKPIQGFQDLARFHTPESWERTRAAVDRLRRDGMPYEIEGEVILPGGDRRWRIIRAEAQRDAGGRIVKLRGTGQDITDRKLADENLRSAHAELAAIHAHAPIMFLVVDECLRVRKVNETVMRLGSYREAEILGLAPGGSLGCLNSSLDPRGCGYGPKCGNCALQSAVLDTIRTQTTHANIEAWLPARVGETREERCLLVFTAPLQLSGINEALICALDITDRKRAEKALRDSEYWLRESQRISHVGSYVLDLKQGVWTTSETLDVIFGIGPAYPKSAEGWGDLIHPEERQAMVDYFENEVLRQRKPFDREYRIVRPCDKQVRWVHGRGAFVQDSNGEAVALTGTIQDITDRKIVEDNLRQAQKLEGIGRLAGGIAHDFNNLLTVINGHCDMLLRDLAANDLRRDSVIEISKAGERAAELTGQLLTFSRKQMVTMQPVDLNRLIVEMKGLLERLLGEDIKIETRLEPNVPWVMANEGQLHQVLMNLALNARDAMAGEGRLTITTNVRAHERDEMPCCETGTESHMRLTVTDTGAGMAPETLEHIFDPFFTTKGQGRGTGLGLATVYGIVQQTGGSIQVKSACGEGTTFAICLPATEAVDDPVETATPARAPGGTETILVVEDQDSVRKLAVRILKGRGYRVLEAARGDEALVVAKKASSPIDLLLTDMVMPGMMGPEVAERLRARQPAIKVLYMSGYAEEVMDKRGLEHRGLKYIPKPFTPDELAVRVRDALGSVKARPAAILVVDDESAVRSLFHEILQQSGYQVLTAGDGDQALKALRHQQIDLVLTDLVMPEREGIETIRIMRKEQPSLKIIAMSGAFAGGFLETAKMLGADCTLAKPVSAEILVKTVEHLLEKVRPQ